MKILMITFEFPPQHGGIATYSYQLAKHLTLLGHKVVVLANTNYLSDAEIQQFDSMSHSFNILRYRRLQNKLSTVIHRIAFSLRAFYREHFDLLFIPYPNAGIIAWYLNKQHGIPYAMVGHGGTEFLCKNPILKYIIKLAYNRASVVFANSKYTANVAKNQGIDVPPIVITLLGADDEIFDYQRLNAKNLKKQYGFQDRKIILTVGSLRKRKGQHLVIEAVEKLKNEIPEILYLIVGAGPDAEFFERMIHKRNLSHFVKLMGRADWEQLREYYAMCDVCILNSIPDADGAMEGFGIVLIEANLMGKPVIGTKCSGLEDAIEDGKSGILIPPNSTEATIWALRKLLLDPKLAHKMGEYGYQRAKQQMTWRKVAEKTDRVLKEVLSNGTVLNTPLT